MESLSCCSDLVRKEDAPLPVSDCAGNLLIAPEIWERCRQEMVVHIARVASDYLAQNPAHVEKMVGFELMDCLTE